jgi:hypothetical protein
MRANNTGGGVGIMLLLQTTMVYQALGHACLYAQLHRAAGAFDFLFASVRSVDVA